MASPQEFKLPIPRESYSKEEEDRFRREMETILVALAYEIANISFGTNNATSLYYKRGLASNLPVGVTTYP